MSLIDWFHGTKWAFIAASLIEFHWIEFKLIEVTAIEVTVNGFFIRAYRFITFIPLISLNSFS